LRDETETRACGKDGIPRQKPARQQGRENNAECGTRNADWSLNKGNSEFRVLHSAVKFRPCPTRGLPPRKSHEYEIRYKTLVSPETGKISPKNETISGEIDTISKETNIISKETNIISKEIVTISGEIVMISKEITMISEGIALFSEEIALIS
jgi:hypothetical protein